MPGDMELILQTLRDIQETQRATRRENAENFRGVHTKFDNHAAQDVQGFNSVRGEIGVLRTEVNAQIGAVRTDVAAIGERVATLEGKEAGEQRATEEAAMGGFFGMGPNGTGRYPRLPSSPEIQPGTPPYGTQVPPQSIVVPTPAPGTHISVRVGEQKKYDSIPPFFHTIFSWFARLLRKVFRSTASKIGGVFSVLLVGWLTRHLMDPLFSPKSVDGAATLASAPSVIRPSPFPSAEPSTLPAIPAAMPIDASVQSRDSGAGLHR